MKILLILRHGKSPHLEGVDDHERPLFPESRRQIGELARQLAAMGVVPGTVLSSDAVRAAETARAYSLAVKIPEPLLLADLYDPGAPEDVLDAIRAGGGHSDVVLVVGHNPGLEEFCNVLTKHPQVDRLGTGSLAAFEVGVEAWTELRLRQARLRKLYASH